MGQPIGSLSSSPGIVGGEEVKALAARKHPLAAFREAGRHSMGKRIEIVSQNMSNVNH
jgi:hypothetical protein